MSASADCETPPIGWTEWQYVRLKELRLAGWSSQRIGAVIGMSKNAVAGVTTRRRLPCPAKVERPPRPEYNTVRQRVIRLQPMGQLPTAAPPVMPRTMPCCWSLNDTRPYLFCGAKTYGRSVFCPEHAGLGYLRAESA